MASPWPAQANPGHRRWYQPEEEFSFLLNALADLVISSAGEVARILRQSATSVVCVSWSVPTLEKVSEGNSSLLLLLSSPSPATPWLGASSNTHAGKHLATRATAWLILSVQDTTYPTSAAGLLGS